MSGASNNCDEVLRVGNVEAACVRSCSKEGKWGMLGLMLCLSQTADHMWRVLHSAC